MVISKCCYDVSSRLLFWLDYLFIFDYQSPVLIINSSVIDVNAMDGNMMRNIHIIRYRVISPYCRIIPRCCGPTEMLRMMGKVSNEPPIMDVYFYMFTRPYFLGRDPSGDNEL